MKTNRRFLQLCAACVLLLLCRQELQAQQKDDRIFLARGRHSLGVNLYPVVANLGNIDKLHSFELTYKLQVKDSDRAWRFGVLGQYDKNHYKGKVQPIVADNPPYSFSNSNSKYLLAGGYTGHEWQTTLAKRWLFGYGADLGYSYTYEYRYDYYEEGTPVDYSELQENTFHTHKIFAKAFIEINFAITSYLLVNAGFSMYASYQYYTTSPELTLLYGPNVNTPRKPDAIKQHYVDFRLLPFQQLSIIYVF